MEHVTKQHTPCQAPTLVDRPIRRAFPLETWRRLCASDFLILDELVFLSNLQAARSPTRARYCTPGREYLSAKVGITRWEISRRTTFLAAHGLIEKRQRRPVGGRWQTVLYIVKSGFAWRWSRLRRLWSKLPHRVRPPRTQDPPQKEETILRRAANQPIELKQLLDAWMKRGQGG